MNDLVAKLRLDASAGNVPAVVAGVRREVESLAPAGQKAAGGLRQVETASAGVERSARGAGAAAGMLSSALAAVGLQQFAGSIKDAAFQVHGLQTGLEAVAGGAAGAAEAQAYVRDQSQRLGLVIRDQAQGFMQLAASTNGTRLQGEQTRKIWLGLAEAGAALNRTEEQRKRGLEAIAQMAGKGVVSQEELRQQLVEAIPGASQIAARAMGLTTQEMNKLVDSGKLLSENFLPKFAAQLSKEFGGKLTEQLATPLGRARVELAEFTNVTQQLEATVGTSFLEGLTSGVAALNDQLATASTQDAAKAFGHDLGVALGTAAQGAAFLVDHMGELQSAAAAIVGVGLARWLVISATEARAAGAAYLAKSLAARSASAEAVASATAETGAMVGLRATIEAAARAELAAAGAARELAVANEQAAVSALTLARAQASGATGGMLLADNRARIAAAERDLVTAQTASTAASARAAQAATTLGKATTLGGSAAQGAKVAFGGLMTLLGGPWMAALVAAGALVGSVGAAMADNKRIQEEAKTSAQGYAQAMRQTAEFLGPAANGVRIFSKENLAAIGNTNGLADAVRGLTGETIRYANARAAAANAALTKGMDDNQLAIDKIDKPGFWASAGRWTQRVTESFLTGRPSDQVFDWAGDKANAAARQRLTDQNTGYLGAKIGVLINKGSYQPEEVTLPPPASTAGGKDKAGDKARERAKDLEAAYAAQERYTAALLAGGSALDEYEIQQAGLQAVERSGLADKPKLTEAEKALVAQIRQRAEDTERLTIANERIERAVGIKRSAEAETKALLARSIAAAQGEAALEALQVREAGLAAVQQLGVDSLSQLTGKTLEHAQAAKAAAEAKERQAIATGKAEKVAGTLRDLDQRISAEKAYTVAVAGGVEALVAYQREENARREIERAGTNLTIQQIAAIREKANALFAVQAAGDAAALDQRQAEELRLQRLSNVERAVEERYLQRKGLLLAQGLNLTREELEARARALALADEAAAQDAAAVGDLKNNLRDAFIESGKLGFEDVGDFVERRLRQAVFDALLAKPIDILINAVVGSVSGGSMLNAAGGGLGTLGGASGLGSLFTSAGGLAGLTTATTKLATSALSKLGVGNAAGIAGGLGAAAGGAGTGMIVSSIAGMLGMKQSSGNKIGGTIGSAIGSFIPIPGGAILGSIAGNLIGGLIGGKASNHAAVATLDSAGKVTSMGGAKRTDETTAAAQSVADAVAQVQAALVAGGAKLTATVSQIDIGTRDKTHLNFSNGQSIDTAVGDVAAAIDAATRTILSGAQWASEAQTAYAQKLMAAGATIEEVISTMQVATGFMGSIDDAIAQLTDPAAYAKKQALDAIDANYQALKKQAQELIAANLASTDVLAKIDALKDLQVDDALKRLASAADGAAGALTGSGFQASIADQIAQLTDPVAFERAKGLQEVDATIKDLQAQAQRLVDAGKLSSDVFAELEKLRDLKTADSIKKLGDAASDTAKALQNAADFGAGIDDAILQLVDPVAAKVAQITRDYESKVAQAQAMIAAGSMSGDVLGKLAMLRDLQLDEVFKNMAGSANDAAKAFAEARPRLQSWLDGLAVGSNTQLNPDGQRQAAMVSYERVLAQARAGDAEALSSITQYADQLLSSDRTATESASDRLALFNRIQNDISGLASQGGGSANPVVTAVSGLGESLKALLFNTDPARLAALGPQPVDIQNIPILTETLRTIAGDQTRSVVGAVDKARAELSGRLASVEGATSRGLSQFGAVLDAGLDELGVKLQEAVAAAAAAGAAASQAVADALEDMKRQTALDSALGRQGRS